MEPHSLDVKLEALLFVYGEPMEEKKAAKILGVPLEEVHTAAGALGERLVKSGSALTLLANDGRVQLVTKPAFSELAQTVLKNELQEELTPAALETLAIVSYAGSAPRSVIDYIRGVNSSFILRALLIRGLVERSLDPARGNAYRYAPSFELLRHLGLQKLEDLPDFSRLNGLITKLSQGNA